MTLIEYAKEVDLQDRLQQEYFRTRNYQALEDSKRQERKVRALTKEILSGEETLF